MLWLKSCPTKSKALTSGPTNLTSLGLSKYIAVDTAQEMFQAVMEHFTYADVIISAAVADFS